VQARRDGILIGLLGRGIQSSRTPTMHEREGARLGLDYTYLLIDFDTLGLPDAALGAVAAATGRMGFAGLNVTHPFKLFTGIAADPAAMTGHFRAADKQATTMGGLR
jgi:shikimate dehydrogenase